MKKYKITLFISLICLSLVSLVRYLNIDSWIKYIAFD